MSFQNWLKDKFRRNSQSVYIIDNHEQIEESNHSENENFKDNEIIIVYLTTNSPDQLIINLLHSINNIISQVFENEDECINYMSSIVNKKFFLILDKTPSNNLLTISESLPQIYSLFIYSPTEENHTNINRYNTMNTLIDAVKKSRAKFEKETVNFSLFNGKEKTTRNLDQESGSFLFFQLFKNVIMNMPKTLEAKQMMLEKCQKYYSNNQIELKNIKEFDQTYKATQAIQWYTKESFVYKLVNKALRTEDVDFLYYFRFYIVDLCKQLELKSDQLRKDNQNLTFYRGQKLSQMEIDIFRQSIGTLISPNGYLSVSRLYSVAYDFVTKPTNRIGVLRALFEYTIDLNLNKIIVVADIAQYSVFPEEAEALIDIGACFRIDSCEFDSEKDLWYIKVHATDEGATIASEYIDYYKNKIADANIGLMFGHLLVEMGQYGKAEKYFDNILNSSNPNDEEIACIYFNFGRTHRFEGDFDRAIDYYKRAYKLHLRAKPKRLYSAAKAINGLGLIYREQNNLEQALEYFQQALKLYHQSIPRQHVDVANTLINLSSVQCDQERYNEALSNVRKAIEIYNRCLPSGHPNHALSLVSLANIHLNLGEINLALDEYNRALHMQEESLPNNHPDIARTLYDLALVQIRLDHPEEARDYFQRAINIGGQTLSVTHPFMRLITVNQKCILDNVNNSIITHF